MAKITPFWPQAKLYEPFYYIEFDGSIELKIQQNFNKSNIFWKSGNYFIDIEKAKKVANKILEIYTENLNTFERRVNAPYWWIDSDFRVVEDVDEGVYIDDLSANIGNYFTTIEAAEIALNKILNFVLDVHASKPRRNEIRYWYITDTGISNTIDRNDECDIKRREIGNWFENDMMAQKAFDRFKNMLSEIQNPNCSSTSSYD